jgi:hypothetical protein
VQKLAPHLMMVIKINVFFVQDPVSESGHIHNVIQSRFIEQLGLEK